VRKDGYVFPSRLTGIIFRYDESEYEFTLPEIISERMRNLEILREIGSE
jgi:hypothetical protein